MLAAAHALAMDAKNLLDVIDAIRIRFPQIQGRIIAQSMKSNSEQHINSGNDKDCSTSNPTQSIYPIKFAESQYLAKSSSLTEGAYDNAQISNFDGDNIKTFSTTANNIPVATLTTIHNKDNSMLINASQRTENSYINQIGDHSENDSCTLDSKGGGNELKIVEPAEGPKKTHMSPESNRAYSNKNLKQETVSPGIILPKPVSCAFVQQHQPVYSHTQKINSKLPHFAGKLQEK